MGHEAAGEVALDGAEVEDAEGLPGFVVADDGLVGLDLVHLVEGFGEGHGGGDVVADGDHDVFGDHPGPDVAFEEEAFEGVEGNDSGAGPFGADDGEGELAALADGFENAGEEIVFVEHDDIALEHVVDVEFVDEVFFGDVASGFVGFVYGVFDAGRSEDLNDEGGGGDGGDDEGAEVEVAPDVYVHEVLAGHHGESDRDPALGEEAHADVILQDFGCAGKSGTDEASAIFSGGASDDVNRDQSPDPSGHAAELKAGADEDKKHNLNGRSEFAKGFEEGFAALGAFVDENDAGGHGAQDHIEVHGEANPGHEEQAADEDGEGALLAFAAVKDGIKHEADADAEGGASAEVEDDSEEHVQEGCIAANEDGGDGGAEGVEDHGQSIVEGDHGDEAGGERTFGSVFPEDIKRGGGVGRGTDGAENNASREGDGGVGGHEKQKQSRAEADDKEGTEAFTEHDAQKAFAVFFKDFAFEFAADEEADDGEGKVAEGAEARKVLLLENAEARFTDQETNDNIADDLRDFHALEEPCAEDASEHADPENQ